MDDTILAPANDAPESGILVIGREEGLGPVKEEGMRQWYDWQPGVLFPYGRLSESGPFYFGGLTREKDRFVLVLANRYNAYRRELLCELARQALGDGEA